ncbi:MAG: hypothetical protein AB7O97_12815 [Planctomycetota bacterium]
MRILALPLLTALAPAQFFLRDVGPQPPQAVDQIVHDLARARTVALLDTGTWEHDGFAWAQVPTGTVPPARYEHAMVFDGTRVLLYGGQAAAGGALGDFWSYNGASWAPVPMGGTNPGLRRAAALAHDQNRGRTVLFGGTDMLGGFPDDTWEWDGATWTRFPQAAIGSPGSRVWHRMVFDPVAGRTVLCGGAMNPVLFTDTWQYDGISWAQTNASGLPPRLNAGLVYDWSQQRVVLLGGQDALGLGNDVLAYDTVGASWSTLPVANALPSWLVSAAAYDVAAGRTVLFGQQDLFDPTTETHYLYGSGALTASYTPFGAGCAGGTVVIGGRPGVLPPAQLSAVQGSLPVRGTTFGVRVGGVGSSPLVLLGLGLSNTQSGGQPLPLDLGPVGMPGCPLLIDPIELLPTVLAGGDAEWTLRVPLDPLLAGLVFHQQAWVIDPTAAGGIGSVSNAATGVVQ